ncbi:hypothetical protein Patl1_24741 [Pistacia atlantica]|uniref:Uncharacterized protein n=1 Tax=Pistacia atlantica TaxID=434234 RepID=A0ACC1B483_9ROSI|nr:hypothetical protein Patl1_24741 [Pistacia atlantica]
MLTTKVCMDHKVIVKLARFGDQIPSLLMGFLCHQTIRKKLNKLLKKQMKDTVGTSWFDMPAATITPELKKDLQLLKLRNAFDPKRHYKKGDTKSKTLPKYFQACLACHSEHSALLLNLSYLDGLNPYVKTSFLFLTNYQVGTVIEPSTEFFSSRLNKKERKASLADELLSDPNLGQYRKRKVREIEEQNRPSGNEKWKIKGRQSQKRAKQRRH